MGLTMLSARSPCRCGWSWPGSWASGCPSGSWARAWTTSTTCSSPAPGGRDFQATGTRGRAKYRRFCLPGRVCRRPWVGTARPWDPHLLGGHRRALAGDTPEHSPHPASPGVQCGFGDSEGPGLCGAWTPGSGAALCPPTVHTDPHPLLSPPGPMVRGGGRPRDPPSEASPAQGACWQQQGPWVPWASWSLWTDGAPASSTPRGCSPTPRTHQWGAARGDLRHSRPLGRRLLTPPSPAPQRACRPQGQTRHGAHPGSALTGRVPCSLTATPHVSGSAEALGVPRRESWGGGRAHQSLRAAAHTPTGAALREACPLGVGGGPASGSLPSARPCKLPPDPCRGPGAAPGQACSWVSGAAHGSREMDPVSQVRVGLGLNRDGWGRGGALGGSQCVRCLVCVHVPVRVQASSWPARALRPHLWPRVPRLRRPGQEGRWWGGERWVQGACKSTGVGGPLCDCGAGGCGAQLVSRHWVCKGSLTWGLENGDQ